MEVNTAKLFNAQCMTNVLIYLLYPSRHSTLHIIHVYHFDIIIEPYSTGKFTYELTVVVWSCSPQVSNSSVVRASDQYPGRSWV